MTHSNSMAQQIGQTAIALEKQRSGRKHTSVNVVLSGCTLVITMNGVLSPAEKGLMTTWTGAADLQKVHQLLFNRSSDPLLAQIKRITGFEVRVFQAQEQATASVRVYTAGMVAQVFLLDGRLPVGSWAGE